MTQNRSDRVSTDTEKKISNSSKHQPFEFVLPVKITGVVFWGLALVGLIIAIFLLQGKEQELQTTYQRNMILFAEQLEKDLPKIFFNKEFGKSDIEQKRYDTNKSSDIKQFLEQNFSLYRNLYHFNSFSLQFDGLNIDLGQSMEGDVAFQTIVTTPSFINNGITNYRLTINYPNLAEAVITERKNLLISIGALVFLFGLLLQKVLQYILNKPFLKLLNSAQQFARGDTTARFDESTSDEFGFLSKFINEALDSIVQQQREVYRALSRAKKSELALFKEKELAEVTLHSITDAVITTDSKAIVNYMNPVAERLLGWKKEEVGGLFIADVFCIVDEASGHNINNPLVDLLVNEKPVQETIKENTALKHRDGELLSIELSVAPMKNQDNNVIGGVVVFQDVSESRRMTRQLSFQARHDALTGLFNRRVFENRLAEIVEDARVNHHEHVLCYLDLDQFKIVNDTCGHMAGDELLRQLSVELSKSVRESDLLARLGGDEFGVLLEKCQLEQAESIANSLRKNIKNYHFIWDARIFEVGVSIGVVSINKNSEKISDILSAADLACYAAKDSGRNRIHVYQPTDEELTKRHSEMHCVTRINNALEDDSFIIYKQPIMSLGTEVEDSACVHWEVLLRMKNLQDEVVSPNEFISAAERYNLMPKIDRMVIQKAFSAMSEGYFNQEGFTNKIVGINLSGDSICDENFLSYIKDQAELYSINFKEVCLEVTETVAIANLAKANCFMAELNNLGCQFALDDFGSGLSSFGYLKHLQVDYLKIDGTFVKDMCNDKIDRALVESINQVGHIMGMETIAEWVEDESTLLLLKEMGVDYSQGYYTGKPTPLN
ncbi:MAG: EAL domain-containing protein [Gammaproteobacteria bacterium]|nr:EAL domain-containing protein [Gammaproteobacteria bacterium]